MIFFVFGIEIAVEVIQKAAPRELGKVDMQWAASVGRLVRPIVNLTNSGFADTLVFNEIAMNNLSAHENNSE